VVGLPSGSPENQILRRLLVIQPIDHHPFPIEELRGQRGDLLLGNLCFHEPLQTLPNVLLGDLDESSRGPNPFQ
jgi:hypothetical protein